jgi:hypothetical protein
MEHQPETLLERFRAATTGEPDEATTARFLAALRAYEARFGAEAARTDACGIRWFQRHHEVGAVLLEWSVRTGQRLTWRQFSRAVGLPRMSQPLSSLPRHRPGYEP